MNWNDTLFSLGDEPVVPTPPAPPIPPPVDPAGYIYIVRDPHGLCKIGRSQHLEQRVNQIAAGLPQGEVELVLVIPFRNPPSLEADLHARFARQRISGEWFSLTQDDIDRLKKEYLHGHDL